MFFNIFRRKKRPTEKKQTAAAEGFGSLLTGLKALAADEVPNKVAVMLVLSVVDMTVRVLVNVAIALGDLTAPFADQYPLKRTSSRNTRSPSPISLSNDGRQSVRGRPIHFDSLSFRSEDDVSINGDITSPEPSRSRDFSFDKPRPAVEDLSRVLNLDMMDDPASSPGSELRPTDSTDVEPEHELLRGFFRKSSAERVDGRRPHHARHLSLEDHRCLPDVTRWSPEPYRYHNAPSPFIQVQDELSCGEYTDTETVERVDSLGTIPESDSSTTESLKEDKSNVVHQKHVEFAVTDGDDRENLEEDHEAETEKTEMKSATIETVAYEKIDQDKLPMTEKKENHLAIVIPPLEVNDLQSTEESKIIKKDSKITQEEEEDDKGEAQYFESPCSSPRSLFSDSAATKFVNSNFCNPEFCEDPIDAIPSPCVGGSIRQRYTMRRLQSLLSQRSRVSEHGAPSVGGKSNVGRPPCTPHQDSMRSFRKKSFRGLGVSSFRSRSGDEDEYQVLSDAYRLVKLETCIRKAWKVSMGDAQQENGGGGGGGGQSFRERESSGKLSPSLQSFKKLGSRRYNRANRISFVKVPADFSNEMLMSRREMLLNPTFGDEEFPINDDMSSVMSGTDGETVMDTSSVVMRTPLRKIGSPPEDYKRCEKNLEEGTFDNPLRLCSFRSYDSDTELELTSVRVRNPISRLLSYRLNRGAKKDCIPLADIDSDEYGALMFDQVNSNPIKGGMMEKYLTQLVIDDTLDVHLMGDVPVCTDEDSLGWSTCQQEWVPHEMDDRLKCFLLDRFLIDNVLNEVDLDPVALKNAATTKGKTGERSTTAPRKLRRS